jgi:hypothetical protein
LVDNADNVTPLCFIHIGRANNDMTPLSITLLKVAIIPDVKPDLLPLLVHPEVKFGFMDHRASRANNFCSCRRKDFHFAEMQTQSIEQILYSAIRFLFLSRERHSYPQKSEGLSKRLGLDINQMLEAYIQFEIELARIVFK